jgi:hypothetical protein
MIETYPWIFIYICIHVLGGGGGCAILYQFGKPVFCPYGAWRFSSSMSLRASICARAGASLWCEQHARILPR